jgi:hypothetical protein
VRDEKRKLQVSNGYSLAFEQLAQILNAVNGRPDMKRVPRAFLVEQTGLAERQVGSLVSIGCAIGVLRSTTGVLTEFGGLVAEHDIFFEMAGTLEFCHYAAAGNAHNVIWFDTFNELLTVMPNGDVEEWKGFFRSKYADEYSKKSMQKHVRVEVRFLVDAYLSRNLRKLELIVAGSDGKLQPRRYANPEPLVLAAMVYNFAERTGRRVWEVEELAGAAGGPAILFRMDVDTFRQNIERLHERGYVRLEARHNLDQVRLRDDYQPLCFLEAYYHEREPSPVEPKVDRQGRLL